MRTVRFLEKILARLLKLWSSSFFKYERELPPPLSNAMTSQAKDGPRKKCDYCKGRGVTIERVRIFPNEDNFSSHHLGNPASLERTTECPICNGNGYTYL